MEAKENQATNKELMQQALEHYTEASKAIQHWRNDIPIAIKHFYSFTEPVGDEEIEQFAEKLSEPLAEKGEYALAMAWKSGAINMAKWLRTSLSVGLTEEKVVDILRHHNGTKLASGSTFNMPYFISKDIAKQLTQSKTVDSGLVDIFRNFIRTEHLTAKWDKFYEQALKKAKGGTE